MFDPLQTLQAKQFIKPTKQTQPGMFLMQPEIARIDRDATWRERLRSKRNRDSTGSDPPIGKQFSRFWMRDDFGADGTFRGNQWRGHESDPHGKCGRVRMIPFADSQRNPAIFCPW